MQTLVVNLFGGPGIGKSTNAALLFGKLKNFGINVEYVPEFAKDLAWEERDRAQACQPYVFGKQLWRLSRLIDNVEVIVTDSPLLLSMVYANEYRSPAFLEFVRESFNRFDNFNILLRRNASEHRWNPKGRQQSEEVAVEIDQSIREILKLSEVPYTEIPVQPGEMTANHLYDLVLRRL